MRAKDKITLGIVDPGMWHGAFAMSMLELYGARKGRINSVIRGEGSGLLSRLRNELVTGFLKGRDEWLWMIDTDETITVAGFDKLCDAADAETRPIMAGVVFGAWPSDGNLPHLVPTIARFNDNRLEPWWDYPADRVVEIDSTGTGCLLVHRRVFEAMRDQAEEHEGREWCWFRDLPIGGRWVSEDVYFLRRAASLGFPIHAHTGVQLDHYKRLIANERLYKTTRERAVVDPRTIERR